MKPPRQWLSELHRRSIWQVLLVYGGASWAVLEVVDTLTDLLRLPSWFPDLAIVLLLVGLPFVLATAFVQAPPASDPAETSRGGSSVVAGADPREGKHGVSPTQVLGRSSWDWLTWRNVLGVGVVIWALWGVVAALWLGLRSRQGTADGSPTIAVLPLDDPAALEPDWFTLGMTDQLITDLSRVEGLTVINAGSSLSYRGLERSLSEIGRELGAGVLLVGSVLRRDHAVRVNARLVEVGTERSLWAESYQRRTEDVLALQAEIARDVARQVQAALGGSVSRPERGAIPAVDPEAHALYLEGRALYRAPSAENLQASLRLFRRAVEMDSSFSLAYAGLADSYLVLGHVGARPADAFTAAMEAAQRALDLDPDLAEAHTALADSRYHFNFDYEAAEAGFRRAIELSPSYATARWWYGGLLATLGRFDQALAQIERARELDPRAPIIQAFLARVQYYARRYEDSEATVRRAAQVSFPVQLTHGALAVFALGRPGEAMALISEPRTPYDLAARVQILAGTGRMREARAVLERLLDWDASFTPPHLVATAYAALGDEDAAMEWLERAYEQRDPALIWVHVDPAFDGLADDPRFRALLRRMGLDPGAAVDAGGKDDQPAGTALAALRGGT